MSKNVASLSDLRKKKDERDDSSGNSSRYNELYTGGGKSGLAVIGGGGGGEMSAEERNGKILRRVKRSKTKEKGSENSTASDTTNDGEKRPSIIITLYRNGFVVGDGPFRPNGEEKNKRFLNDLAKGECPAELETEDHKHSVVELKDKHDTDYVGPAFVAFEGQGRTMSAETCVERAPDMELGEPRKIVADEKKKTVRVQVMLHDRRREVVSCNATTTVKQLWLHVAAITPALGGKFVLLQGYPPKPIGKDAMDSTIGEAGLAGARVMQRKR